MLAESLNEKMVLGSPPEDDEELKKVIHATTHNVIECDKKELMELLEELKEEVTEDFIDNVLQLEKLSDVILTYDYLEGKPLLPMIDKTLDGFSTIPKSKHQHLKMLTGDIKSNRYRVHSIFSRLDDAQDRENDVIYLKTIAC